MTHLTIERGVLAQALGIVARAVSARNTLPALGTILLKSEDHRLRLAATNLEIGLSCWADAQLDGELAIALPARTLTDLVSTLEGGSEVRIHANGECKATLKCGGAKTTLNGLSAEEFPPLPDTAQSGSPVLTLFAAEVKEAIRQTAFVAATDEARPILQGVRVELEGSEMKLVATDGFRLAIRRVQLPAPVEQALKFTIPAAALKELARILPDTNEPLSLYRPKDRAQAAFRLADIELTAQLLEGNFPDYAAILPKSTKLKVLVDTQAFLTACRQVEVIARAGSHVAKLVFTPEVEGRGRLVLSAQSDETGSSEIELPLEKLEGPGLTMAFNVRYLRAVLEAMRGPKLRFEANAHNVPAVILPQNGEEVMYLVMPMYQG